MPDRAVTDRDAAASPIATPQARLRCVTEKWVLTPPVDVERWRSTGHYRISIVDRMIFSDGSEPYIRVVGVPLSKTGKPTGVPSGRFVSPEVEQRLVDLLPPAVEIGDAAASSATREQVGP